MVSGFGIIFQVWKCQSLFIATERKRPHGKKLFMFEISQEEVNNDKILIFLWTIPLSNNNLHHKHAGLDMTWASCELLWSEEK